MNTNFSTVDEYITTQDETHQATLQKIRQIILSAAPQAEEYIGYQMPAYKLHGALVYFAIFKNHIGFYPTGSGIASFQDELAPYKSSKGAVQFQLNEPIPFALIKKIVKFRVKENNEKALTTSKKKVSTKGVTEKQTETAKVDDFLKNLKHPLLSLILETRKFIMDIDSSIGEEIAWNAPSFFFKGKMKPFNPKEYKRSIIVFNFHQKDTLRLILLRGGSVKDQSKILEGSYTDGRRLIMLHSTEDLNDKRKAIKKIVKEILSLMS